MEKYDTLTEFVDTNSVTIDSTLKQDISLYWYSHTNRNISCYEPNHLDITGTNVTGMVYQYITSLNWKVLQ
jgi:hypothetical protein